ncbi:MAG TPA: hypothetical protein VMN58_04785 [Acidimicrobiales bacterium]|nr:hypothetical protein [Acidimicrobiales bacterium]
MDERIDVDLPVAEDVVGTASVRLLRAGVSRPERLEALRLLGILGGHADGSGRVRLRLEVLAGEFAIPEAVAARSLRHLVTGDVVRLLGGDLVVAGVEPPVHGGLRLADFLDHVAASFADDVAAPAARPEIDSRPALIPPPVAVAPRTTSFDDLDTEWLDVPLEPAPVRRGGVRPALAGVGAAVLAMVLALNPSAPPPPSSAIAGAAARADVGEQRAATAAARSPHHVSPTDPQTSLTRAIEDMTTAGRSTARIVTTPPRVRTAPDGEITLGPDPARGDDNAEPDAPTAPSNPTPSEPTRPVPPCLSVIPELHVTSVTTSLRDGRLRTEVDSEDVRHWVVVIRGAAENPADAEIMVEHLTLSAEIAEELIVVTGVDLLIPAEGVEWMVEIPTASRNQPEVGPVEVVIDGWHPTDPDAAVCPDES